jgi:hypothetical protein
LSGFFEEPNTICFVGQTLALWIGFFYSYIPSDDPMRLESSLGTFLALVLVTLFLLALLTIDFLMEACDFKSFDESLLPPPLCISIFALSIIAFFLSSGDTFPSVRLL